MLEETLRAEAQVLHDMLGTHDTADFMRRLAVRITQDTAGAPRENHGDDGVAALEPENATTVTSPTPPPPSFTPQPHRSTRPHFRKRLRRRPTPIVTPDPAVHPSRVLAHVRGLCDTVLRSDDVDTLVTFDIDYDETGARTFACLLYTIDRLDSALYWWRFAAGAGDPLAAHLLAAYHAAVGSVADARAWRANARILGYTEQHLPRPVRTNPRVAQGVAQEALCGAELRTFMVDDHPEALVLH
ncbi:hypothetical protein [Streptomyces sp. 150FB]|uniref:hypothetical protein n=1 Tax=Streptomyces sp. 150FB TaxID=1576605 RepID=UPI000B12891E|nr:hypothetical protein [Streptomyces sp. 150FB]